MGKKKLEEHRKSFMLYLRGEVFLRAALVRVKGEVAGYLTDNMGIIEHKDENDKKINVFFHTDDVMIFKKNIREYNQSAKNLLPVGCLVSCDARRVHISGIKNVEYQAITVLAGFWPLTPHPTLFPGGQGSVAPMYDLPAGSFTFYYLELALEAKLQRKVNQLKDILGRSKGQIQYDWKNVQYVQRVPENAWMHSKLTRCQKRISRMRPEPRSQPEPSLSVLGTLLRHGNMEVSESRTKSRKKWRRVSMVLVEKESRPNHLSECRMIIFSLVQLITLCLVHLNFGCKWFVSQSGFDRSLGFGTHPYAIQ